MDTQIDLYFRSRQCPWQVSKGRVERLIKAARFPVVKTFDGCQLTPLASQLGFDKEQFMSLEFIKQKKNILCIDAVELLGAALGVKACSQDKRVQGTINDVSIFMFTSNHVRKSAISKISGFTSSFA